MSARSQRRPPFVLGAGAALTRQALRDSRLRSLGFVYLFALYAYIQPVGYRHAYPTLAARRAFAHSFAANKGLRLFYGEPLAVGSVEGYTAWRVGGTLAIAAAVFGVLAAVRALRSEEETGRLELVLASAVRRRTAFLAALAAIGAGVLGLFVAELAGCAVAGLPLAGSAALALASASVAASFAGIGAVASQVAPTRRSALELASAAVVLALLLRAAADTVAGLGWLRWATPLGWAEELRPFNGLRPLVVALPLGLTTALLLSASAVAARRDIGSGLLPRRETASPHLGLLSSATAEALRGNRGSLLAWGGGVGLFALVLGVIAQSITSADVSASVEREIAKLGSGSITTPAGYVAFVFLIFILAISLFACAQIGAARHEEAGQQLETLLALPLGRGRWLGGRLLLAALSAGVLALAAGLLTWAGAVSAGVRLSFARMLEAGANCLPVALLFLGLAALAYAAAPRAAAALSYGLVAVAFLWQTVGALLGVPGWLVGLTPFAHVGLVPAEPFRPEAAAVMLALGLAGAAAASWLFRRRDLLGA